MPSNNAVLELDPKFGLDAEGELSDRASGYDSDTTSLMSAAKNHTFENGRRYHGYKEGKYMIPNDEAEKNRMDLFHHCMLLTLRGELFLAPVGEGWKPGRSLDIGTGSGIWATDFADQFPDCEVIGTDLSPIQPEWVPQNLKFEVDDVEEAWSYEDNSFDFIHIRHMAGHIADWPKLYEQAFKALKPGGWIEVQDGCDYFSSDDGSVLPTSYYSQFSVNFEKVSLLLGKQWNSVARAAKQGLKDVGCVQVVDKLIKLPLGRWAKGDHEKELGMYWRQHCLDGAEAYTMAPFTRVLGWEKKAVDQFNVGFSADMKNPKFHAYSKFYFTYGRKPLA
ncbi:hypothetical protein RUND412_010162 [Rhizina undulata]